MQKVLIIGGMAAIAIYLVYSRREKLKGEDPCFREGYTAGFFTPGPFTIMNRGGYLCVDVKLARTYLRIKPMV